MVCILLKRHLGPTPVPPKFASRYLDGDSNFKIEAFNHQKFDKTSKSLYNMEFLGVLKCLGI